MFKIGSHNKKILYGIYLILFALIFLTAAIPSQHASECLGERENVKEKVNACKISLFASQVRNIFGADNGEFLLLHTEYAVALSGVGRDSEAIKNFKAAIALSGFDKKNKIAIKFDELLKSYQHHSNVKRNFNAALTEHFNTDIKL